MPASLLDPETSPLLVHSQLARLPFHIEAWSSFSAQYHPQHILVNRPTDQSSRWSSGSNNQLQFISLRLDSPAVLHTITFGKYHKVHVCNLKEFKVFGGIDLNNMVELLHSGLRNDNEPETFALKYKMNGIVFPCQYVKIVPLQAWGPNFNYSIWYVELRGINQADVVQEAQRHYEAFRETEAVRLCLKHFRQRQWVEPFLALQKQTNVQLEHPMLTRLHQTLVMEGNCSEAEQILEAAAMENLFAEYTRKASYRPIWKRLFGAGPNGEMPSMRGGHQMCMDTDAGIIYMLGGWNGANDLADFWSYNIHTERWHEISSDTRRQGGPGSRSCHKICFDPVSKSVFVLGKYLDPQSRPGTNCESDFYRYETTSNRWTLLSANTAEEGGPDLVYDHQMAVDPERQLLFVFGGRIIAPVQSGATENTYSGLYEYSITSNTWRLIRTDLPQQEPGQVHLKSRIGHSMLFNPKTRQLYIFAGQRHKDYLSDYYIYDIESDHVVEMTRDTSKVGGPDAGFTQRATIDVSLNEFYVFSGLMREKNSSTETVKNTLWVYSIATDTWRKIYHNENTGEAYWSKMADVEPCPRFAHQVVYDDRRHVHYLFGGNPGDNSNMALRLDDFWSLQLLKPTSDDVLRKCRFQLRRLQFHEMCCRGDTIAALKYLQSDLSAVVNHEDSQESEAFRALTMTLFSKERKDVLKMRTGVYEELVGVFPEAMKQPVANLTDFVKGDTPKEDGKGNVDVLGVRGKSSSTRLAKAVKETRAKME